MERSGTARQPQLLGQKKDKFWLTVGLCALTAALFFLPFYIIMLILLILFTYIPALSLGLPTALGLL